MKYWICGLLFLNIQVITEAQTWFQSQKTSDLIKWQNIPHSRIEINQSHLERYLSPNQGPVSIELLYPHGQLSTFQMEEAPIMAQELQDKYPSIKTYKGINNDGELARLSITPHGVHAIVFAKEGTVYIDPEEAKSDLAISYYKRDFMNQQPRSFDEGPIDDSYIQSRQFGIKKMNKSRSSGTEMRSYRIAIAADHSYSEFHGGTISDVLSAIVTTLNRVVGIYENELAITMELIATNDEIIYISESDDPYDGLSTEQMLDVNQENLDEVIGSENYDIGHVFTTGSGGLAGLGVVCNTNAKARGTTGINSPVGDPFDVDFVAHEFGHQFGGNHTFNGNRSSCSGGNRNSSTAYEPGSGSTIMAYAGICGSDNIQTNSDAYFHAASLEEILTYVEEDDGQTCPQITSTTNTPPEVSTPTGSFAIPINTPFSLTASGSDPDGDEITYVWEQYDLGPSGAPGTALEEGPLFRSFAPSTDPTRIFPSLDDILTDTEDRAETLPSVSRELNFRVTVRDNNINGGGTNSADIEFTATDNAGPFLVTSQANNETIIEGGKAHKITWDVANTNNDPVNCTEVEILLSTDGGQTFDETISSSTPNDGEEFVILPNVSTSQARIMVRAVGNIFFDINSADFTIEETTEPDFSLLLRNSPQSTCEDEITYEVQIVGINDFSDVVNLSLGSLPEGVQATLSNTSGSPGDVINLQFENTGSAILESVDLIGISGSLENTLDATISFLEAPSEAPTLFSPEERESGVSLNTSFDWGNLDGNETYTLQVSSDDQFNNLVINQGGLTLNEFTTTSQLASNTNYFWRVNAENECGESEFSEVRKFITIGNASDSFEASDLPLDIISGNTTSSNIDVNKSFTVSDVNIESLNVTHPYVSDLRIDLISPNGTSVTLINQICDNADDIILSLDDESATTLPCPLNDGGTYSPESPLSTFDGESSSGTWTLEVQDLFAGDEGSLNGWTLQLGNTNDELSLFAEATSFSTVDIDWNNISNNRGYEIEISSGAGFSTLGTTSTDVNSLEVSDLSPSTSYIFRVRAIFDDDFSSFSNESPVTTFPGIPDSPENLIADQVSSSQVSLQWTDASDEEEGFIIERSLNGTGSFEEIGRTNQDETIFLDLEAISNNTFAYVIKAFNISGVSDPSNEAVLAVLGTANQPQTTTVFPNPMSDRILISGIEDFQSYSILDVNGRSLILEEPLTNPSVNVSGFKNGIYFLRLHGNTETLLFRFLKVD